MISKPSKDYVRAAGEGLKKGDFAWIGPRGFASAANGYRFVLSTGSALWLRCMNCNQRLDRVRHIAKALYCSKSCRRAARKHRAWIRKSRQAVDELTRQAEDLEDYR